MKISNSASESIFSKNMNVEQNLHEESMGLFLIHFAANPTMEIPDQFMHCHNPYYNYFCSTPWNFDNPITLVVQDTPLLREEAFKRNLTNMMFFGSNLDPVNVLTLTQVYELRMEKMIVETLDGILDDVVPDLSESVVNSIDIVTA